MEEYAFNIWFVVDSRTECSVYFIVRAYNIEGTEKEKLDLLKKLAKSDYRCGHRVQYPVSCKVINSYKTQERCLHLSSINEHFDINLDWYIKEIESQIPGKIYYGDGGLDSCKLIRQHLPESPLFVKTILIEDDHGALSPCLSKEEQSFMNTMRTKFGF